MESSRLRSSFVFAFCLLITGLAQDPIIQAASPQQHESTSWQKVCMILGIILVGIAAVIYGLRRRNLNVGELLRGYVVTSQAQVTFVNFKNQNQRGAEVVIETSHTIDKSTSFQDDNSYLSKDQQLSIDQGADTENRQLSSVFQRKQGTKLKKSKTRKRLANVAKVSQNGNEDENSQISQDSDL